jgi:hypothetical protein
MADALLHYFWIMVTALFIFSAAYCWFVAIIVRRSLPGEMVWIFMGLAWITGSNAFIRSGEMIIDPATVQIVSRAMFFMVGISSCVAAVQLGKQYNGDVSERIPLTRQWRMLRRGVMNKSEERVTDGPETRTGGDCWQYRWADHGADHVADHDGLSQLDAGTDYGDGAANSDCDSADTVGGRHIVDALADHADG